VRLGVDPADIFLPRVLLDEHLLHRHPLRQALARGKSLFLFGARQTGKTTLVNRFPCAMRVSLSLPDVRLRYERSPGLLRGEVEALKVQDLVDRGRARFILTGSAFAARAGPAASGGRVDRRLAAGHRRGAERR
jgi:hypothetical protein